MSSTSSLIERLKNKPKPQAKTSIVVGIKAAPKESVVLKTKINDLRKDGVVPDREAILRRYKQEKAIVKKVEAQEEQPVSKRPPVTKEEVIKIKPRKKSPGSSKPRKLKGKKLKIVGISKGTISSATPLDKKRRRITKKPNLSIIAEDIPEGQVIEGVLIDPKRIPSDEQKINIRASSYYLNNREIFLNFINSLFSKYRDALLDDASKVSCESRKDNAEFSLLTHQRIVRDYLNLYTPYRGLLLYHGLGSGKTCSSIAIAEGIKTAKNVIVMTPASLRRNYIEELKKCGDTLYKKNQNWEFIPITSQTAESAALTDELSSILSLSKDWIKKNRGAWLVDIRKPTNYESLSADDKVNLDNQLNEMIRDKYQFINYNGLRNDHLDKLTHDGDINPFDNKVIIIDEAHNFVSRIVNKMGRRESLSQRLYQYLMMAENCRIVLLTGTPIINYPNEIGILFNILRGYIKTFTVPITVKTESKVDQARIRRIIDTHSQLDKIIDYVEYKASSKLLTFTRNPFGFSSVVKKGTYDGVKSETDDRGNITDADMIELLSDVMQKSGISVVKSGVKIDNYKALPDTLDEFKDMFINSGSGDLKNTDLFQRRIIGLTSYFKSAQESLMPEFDKDKNIHIIRIEMSPYQFGIYESARQAERKQETNNRKKKAKGGEGADVFDDSVSTYRIFSRAFCNFVFPRTIGRPMPAEVAFKMAVEEFGKGMAEILKNNKDLDEDTLDAATTDERIANVDGRYTEDDRADLKKGQAQLQDTYAKAILKALSDLQDNAEYFLTPEGKDGSGGLSIYSPKFLHILENIQDSDHVGLHLIYSQFRTIEGIGVLKLVLEANGFAQFKIKKNADVWTLDIREEDRGKPTFALYTGTEDQEEKEIIRNIYNSAWEYVPNNIVAELKKISSNNNLGEIIKVFMITSSGAEGISLRNTRYVHIVEPYWHPVRTEQVIGRARRICSHEDLPEDLRTVDVFLYLMTFSEEQLTSDESIELRLKDKSKLNDTPLTSDEALFEISNIKDEINKKILTSVKQSAMDCSLHSRADAKEPIVCYSFGQPKPDRFAYYPALAHEERDAVKQANLTKVTWKAKEVTISGKKYAYRKETGEVYDLDSYKQAIKIAGVDPILKGKLEKDAKGRLKFIEL